MRRLAACVSPGAVRVDRTLWEGYNQDAGLEMACVWLCAPTTSSDRRGNFSPSRAGTFSTSHPASFPTPALPVNGFHPEVIDPAIWKERKQIPAGRTPNRMPCPAPETNPPTDELDVSV